MDYLRAGIFYLGYWLSILVYGVIAGIIAPLLWLPRESTIRQQVPKIMVTWNRFILLWLRICCGVRYQVHQPIEKLPTPCVVVANHQSPWETFSLQCICFPLTTILKRELLHIPVFGWALRLMEPISINRGTPVQALKQVKNGALTRLKEGKNILIFAEGTRMPPNKLGTFKRSAADIAQAANVPLVPIAHNSGEHWLNKKVNKKSGTIHITLGAPIIIGKRDTKQIIQEVQAWVEKVLASYK